MLQVINKKICWTHNHVSQVFVDDCSSHTSVWHRVFIVNSSTFHPVDHDHVDVFLWEYCFGHSRNPRWKRPSHELVTMNEHLSWSTSVKAGAFNIRFIGDVLSDCVATESCLQQEHDSHVLGTVRQWHVWVEWWFVLEAAVIAVADLPLSFGFIVIVSKRRGLN